LKFCPQCGAAVIPGKKFCTSCGASLTPDLPATPSSPSFTAPAGQPPAVQGRFTASGFIAVAVHLIVIIALVLIGYPMLTGSNILSSTGLTATPAPTPVPTEKTPGESYVIVETIETPPPTTLALPTETTLVPTTIITNVPTPTKEIKPVICPSDRIRCDNKCVDLQTDSSNCGYCKTTCLAGQSCLNGQCQELFCRPDELHRRLFRSSVRRKTLWCLP